MIAKLVLWIILFYLVSRVLRGIFRIQVRMNGGQPRGYQSQQQTYSRHKEGETSIKSRPETKSSDRHRHSDGDDGEYIDYVEIK